LNDAISFPGRAREERKKKEKEGLPPCPRRRRR
jgi:hypothetical protein